MTVAKTYVPHRRGRKMSIIDDILRREGSKFTKNPLDQGGATKFGITQFSWDAYKAPEKSLSVEFLTEAQARKFYAAWYVRPFAWLPAELQGLVIDSAVQHGRRRAIRWLQLDAGLRVDGIAGPKTKAAVTAALYAPFLRRRLMFYANIVDDRPEEHIFIHGWMTRLSEFIR